MKNKKANIKNLRRSSRTRARLKESGSRPRLTVFRSNVAFYAQIIDDAKAVTLAAATAKEIEQKKDTSKIQVAEMVGELIAKKAKEMDIKIKNLNIKKFLKSAKKKEIGTKKDDKNKENKK